MTLIESPFNFFQILRGNSFFRFVDRYFGIPLVFSIGLFHKRRKKPNKIQKIAIFKSAAIGDLVLISAILRDIKEKYPNCNVTLVLGSDNHSLLPLLRNYDNIIRISVSKPFKAIRSIRKEYFDCFVDFGSWPRIDAIISFFSNSKCVVGFKTKRQFRHYVYDVYCEHNNRIHELDNYRNIVNQFLYINYNSLPHLFINNSKKFIEKEFIFVHMWPGGYKSYHKEWKKENWLKLFQRIIKDKYIIVLSGPSNSEKENDFFVRFFGQDKVINIAGKYNLTDIAGLMDQSVAVVSVNTGIAHMSAALSKPTVCLNGPTSPIRWAPIGEYVKNVNSTKQGAGFLNLGFEYNNGPSDTMDYISVDSVYSQLSEIIN